MRGTDRAAAVSRIAVDQLLTWKDAPFASRPDPQQHVALPEPAPPHPHVASRPMIRTRAHSVSMPYLHYSVRLFALANSSSSSSSSLPG